MTHDPLRALARETLKKLGLRGDSFDLDYLRRMGLGLRLSPDQFEAALLHAQQVQREADAQIVEAEPEMEGSMPPQMRERFEADLEDTMRAVVRATKKSILATLRSQETP